MIESIGPINAEMRLAQILGEDSMAQASQSAVGPAPGTLESVNKFPGNMFDDVLAKAINSLEGVSRSEIYANGLIDKYLRGEAEMQDVMVAQSKASIEVNLAITTINAAVTSFKEITQLQV
ncbi:flagellar hook-basal body complex protein FliE [Candidatus Saganbacteria bacterium]|nr:flagellar hook-basal body complex protein FliE [Candidatus Saganbacteria bacterium]